MIYRHFFWHFDGTLYDTYGRVTRACLRALADFGISASFEEVYALAKHTLGEVTRVFSSRTPGVTPDDIEAAYRRHAEEEDIENVLLYPGCRETLEAIIRCGGENYLYTHRGQSTFKFLRKDDLEGLFADRVTGLDGFPRKPAPDALQYLANKHGLALPECVMVGDRDIDLDAGKNAGMACALFDPDGMFPDYDTPWRFRDMDTLRKTLVEG